MTGSQRSAGKGWCCGAFPVLVLSPRQTLVPHELLSRRVLLRIRCFYWLCLLLDFSLVPAAPGRTDPLQGTGLTPAWLKHRSGTSSMGLFRWEQPGSVLVTVPHAVPCGIPGPSGLAPCRAAVLPCAGGSVPALPYVAVPTLPRGQRDRLCCAFCSQISP